MKNIFNILINVCLFAIAYCKYTVTQEAWFDVEIRDMDVPGEDYKGRFVIGLFGDDAPVTVLNFASLAQGYKVRDVRKPLSYKHTKIHRIVKDFVIQLGDIDGGTSIYGGTFNDEAFVLSHRAPGMVAMANHGRDTNESQFYILLNKARWLDGKHVVFGKIISGFDVVKTIGDVEADTNTAKPTKVVKVFDCGSYKVDKPYTLTEEQVDSVEDL